MDAAVSSRPRKTRRRRNKPRRRGLDWLVYGAMRLAIGVSRLIPAPLLPWMGRWLGRGMRRVDRRREATARKNLALSRGIVLEDGIPAFLDRMYDQLGEETLRVLRLPRAIRRSRAPEPLVVEIDQAKAVLDGGRGLVVLAGHLGPYESLAIHFGTFGYPINAVARPLPNPHIDRYIRRLRTASGNRMISSVGGAPSAREMVRALERGEIMIFEIDTDARRSGLLVDFCGRPASTFRVPARLALRTGCPVVVVDCHRDASGACVLRAVDPIEPADYQDLEHPVDALTTEAGRRFDTYVRAHPDQWFWLFDRWHGAEKQQRERDRRDLAGLSTAP